MGIDEGGRDPVLGQGVGQKVEAAAVDGLLGHDVAAVGRERLDRVGDGRRAGSQGQRRAAALQGCQPFLQDLLGGIGQTAVDIAGIGQAETIGGVLTVVKNIGGGLVDRHRTGIRGRIGLLLSDVQLKGLKSVFAHDYLLKKAK